MVHRRRYLATLVAASCLAAPLALHAQDVVKVGSIWSISGAASSLGLAAAQGTRLAVAEINKEGFKVGDKTYKLQLIEVDTKSDPSAALSGISKLVERDRVSVVFGDIAGTTTKPMIDVTQRAKVPHFAPPLVAQAAVNETTEKVPFLINSNNPYGGENGVLTTLGTQTFAKLGIKTVVMVNQDEASSRIISPLFRQSFEKAGGKVLADEFLPSSTTDFSAVISRLKALKPDALFLGYSDSWMVPFVTQARQADLAKWYIGAPGASTVPATKTGKEPLSTYVWVAPVVGLSDTGAGMVDYVKRYEAFTGTQSSSQDALSMLSYPWVYAYVEALKRAGTVTDSAKVMASLRGQRFEFPNGPVPAIRILPNGQGATSFQVCSLTVTPNCKRVDQ
ncbi:ABC transporter substrate-binding protein [Variovorax paradoxus]|nr:ABC transporter substrate-binding protein [Variovorax paradoxus]MBT2301962.1 ABC transporter substrate-binding protein [Variovorax paradoxus]